MKLLIYGSQGWIGSQFKAILDEKQIIYYEGVSRVDQLDKLETEITSLQPTHIISFIGRTHGKIGNKPYTTIDYLEQEGKLVDNIRDNLFSPLSLALIAEKHQIHYTYLGTGCIFNFDESHPFGDEQGGFTESEVPNFFGSSYSIVKGYTDRLMTLIAKNTLNLRIRMPITDTDHPRNFIKKITSYDKICSQPNSMTVLPILLPKIIELMRMNYTGTLNFTNPGLISHNEILNLYRDLVDPNFTWNNFSLDEQDKILDSKRSNNCLATDKLVELFPDLPNIREAVTWCLTRYPKVITSPTETNKKLDDNWVDELDYMLNGKNLLVTGGCGFIASNFINYMMDKYPDLKIFNLDCLYYCAREDNILERHRSSSNYQFIKGNINSEDIVNYILNNYQINCVIHFAAQSHVQNSFDNSRQFTEDNVKGTHNLLECCKKYGKLDKFIHVSTDEVYGESIINDDNSIKSEKSVLCPTNPYAATKAGAELIAQSYGHSYHMPIIITRGNNVFGPNQYPEKLIPRFIKLLKENKRLTIHGDGSCVRAFLHSYDTATAFETILLRGDVGEIYNIGCDEGMEYSVMEVAKLLIKRIKNTEDYQTWLEYVADRPFNDQRYYIDNGKLKALGWDITISFTDGLDRLLLTD